jgi:uncharacterized protein
MSLVTLGSTGITVNKNGFGAIPIQRISQEAAVALLQKAYQNNIRFFDTARAYTDSEAKIGFALHAVRKDVYIASKTMAFSTAQFWADLDTTLCALQTDYLDLYQFHNPMACPKPGDGTGLYEAMLAAQSQGIIRHIGISSHRLPVAKDAVQSGLYATVQFPFSYLATDKEIDLVQQCCDLDIGFIAMKAFSGGLIKNSAAAYAFLNQDEFAHILPIWGIEQERELDEFIAYSANPPQLNAEQSAIIERDRRELSGDFCRGCGYCLPCPAGIEIPAAARMSLLIRRSSVAIFLSDFWKEKMSKVDNCNHCNHCKDHCPYGLNTPKLLAENWDDYQSFLKLNS